MAWTAGLLKTGRMSIGITAAARVPSTTRVSTITVTAIGLRNEARISPFMAISTCFSRRGQRVRRAPGVQSPGRDHRGTPGGNRRVTVRWVDRRSTANYHYEDSMNGRARQAPGGERGGTEK